MRQERSSAAKQINRSLKAWRESQGGQGGGGGAAKIPTGGGSPLPGGVRQSMERKLGADLSDVNIHTGGDSAGAAKDLNARAFATGTDVHFGAGEFDPGSKEGKKLLAHELTHVVQAKRSGISRSEGEEGESEGEGAVGEKNGEQLEVSDPEEPAEKEADEVAEKVTADEPEGEEAEAKGDGDAATAAAPGEEEASPIAAKPISIAAKLKGVGLKIFRAAQLSAAERDKRMKEMTLKIEQENELMQTLRAHVAKLKSGWKVGKAGFAGVWAPVGGLIVSKSAALGAATGLAVAGPIGAIVGGFLAGGGSAIATFLGGNKVKSVLDKPVDDLDAALDNIEKSLESGHFDVESALEMIRSKEVDVKFVFDTLRAVAASKQEADKTEEQLKEEKKKAEEEKKKKETLGDKAGKVGEGTLDAVSNVGQTGGASVDAVAKASGVLKEFSSVAEQAGDIGGNAEWLGVGVEGVRATLQLADWKRGNDSLPQIRNDVDRLRLELGLPPLDRRSGGQ